MVVSGRNEAVFVSGFLRRRIKRFVTLMSGVLSWMPM